MENHIAEIQKRFRINVEIEKTKGAFFKGGQLFRQLHSDDYCFIVKRSDVFISFFKSGWIPLEKIEKDWLDSEISFLMQNAQETKLFIERMV